MSEKPSARQKRKQLLQKSILTALFAALSYGVCVLLHFPVAGFLTLDFKDAIIAIAGMFLGPVAALAAAALSALIEFLTISGTGVYGLIMNFVSSAAFAVTAAAVYKHRKTFSGAIIALSSGVVSMTVIMMLANLLVTPFYTGMPVGKVVSMLPTVLLPFNLIKAALNAALVALLYKPLTAGVSRLFPDLHPRTPLKPDKKSFFLALGAVAVIVAALLVLFLVFDAKIVFGK
ncbi:MAG: ECF transporter S component [Clostridia bacterium]|nr:ECF transporter S component [Clostridia bacterium]